MKQDTTDKPSYSTGSHVDSYASFTKLTALQAPTAIFRYMCAPYLGCTGGNNDIDAGTHTDFVGACTRPPTP